MLMPWGNCDSRGGYQNSSLELFIAESSVLHDRQRGIFRLVHCIAVFDEDFPTKNTWNKGDNGDISLESWLGRKMYASHITSIYAIVE